MELGEILKEARKRIRKSLKDAAKEIGVELTKLHRWETEKTVPPLDLSPKIAKALRLDEDFLLRKIKEAKKLIPVTEDLGEPIWTLDTPIFAGEYPSGLLEISPKGKPIAEKGFSLKEAVGDDAAYIVQYTGRAIEGYVKSGDYLVITPSVTPRDGNWVLAIIKTPKGEIHEIGGFKFESDESNSISIYPPNRQRITASATDAIISKIAFRLSALDQLPVGENTEARWRRLLSSD